MSEVHYFTCDFCGRKIEEGKRIASTVQRIRRTPEYKFKFDMCIDCYELLRDLKKGPYRASSMLGTSDVSGISGMSGNKI